MKERASTQHKIALIIKINSNTPPFYSPFPDTHQHTSQKIQRIEKFTSDQKKTFSKISRKKLFFFSVLIISVTTEIIGIKTVFYMMHIKKQNRQGYSDLSKPWRFIYRDLRL